MQTADRSDVCSKEPAPVNTCIFTAHSYTLYQNFYISVIKTVQRRVCCSALWTEAVQCCCSLLRSCDVAALLLLLAEDLRLSVHLEMTLRGDHIPPWREFMMDNNANTWTLYMYAKIWFTGTLQTSQQWNCPLFRIFNPICYNTSAFFQEAVMWLTQN